jgi:three-Cys-motif partner protein
MKNQPQLDEIGYWSEIKLEILKKYAAAYSTILTAHRNPSLYHVYINAFAGAGVHVSKGSGQFVLGSPLNALAV